MEYREWLEFAHKCPHRIRQENPYRHRIGYYLCGEIGKRCMFRLCPSKTATITKGKM